MSDNDFYCGKRVDFQRKTTFQSIFNSKQMGFTGEL